MKNYYGSSSLFVFKNIFFEGLESELLTYRRGRIALNGWANCNSPLRVCYPNIGKYTYKSCKYTKKRRHGHGMRAFACVVGAKSASWRSGVCDEIHPHYNSSTLQFTHTAICLLRSLKIVGSGRRQRCYV